MPMQSEVNIGLVGHVDHGKTTLTKALSGRWTDTHSEEIRRGISIRLGYADIDLYRCESCPEPDCFTTDKKCGKCGGEAKLMRRVSFVDAPGHETLMATMLSGAAIMDGALLVIAANEKCPQPQTAEHLTALDSLGIKNIVIAQNKVDLVESDRAKENFKEIKEFIKGTSLEDAPIIPIAAHYGVNMDILIQAMEEFIPTPERDKKLPARMYVARSFDINKPGVDVTELSGGILGGSLTQGEIKVGDEIELSPGVKKKNTYRPITTKVVSLSAGGEETDAVDPGGLIAIGTELDPSLTKSDNLSGNVVGKPGTLPPVRESLKLDVKLLDRLIGFEEDIKPIAKGEPLMLSCGSAVTVGVVQNPGKGELALKLPVCADEGDKVALSRRVGARWHLIGYGVIKD
ncbi:MAG: translation initiation factor IF-2 subunit gamma [Candidatus Altiarchaeales archaeon]|nr:translation initiation factor IF-2 subunit gamma [Candidatus Altiarchaeales archaeon]MBD3415745.1 translation initiation factor IF-2 subunit gamma [Candidatus Altiarchaeales archaeon]